MESDTGFALVVIDLFSALHKNKDKWYPIQCRLDWANGQLSLITLTSSILLWAMCNTLDNPHWSGQGEEEVENTTGGEAKKTNGHFMWEKGQMAQVNEGYFAVWTHLSVSDMTLNLWFLFLYVTHVKTHLVSISAQNASVPIHEHLCLGFL